MTRRLQGKVGKHIGQGSLTARGRCWERIAFHGFTVAVCIDIFKPHFSDIHFNIIFSYRFTSQLIPLLFTEYMLSTCLIPYIRATCLAHIILLDPGVSANDTWLKVQIMKPLAVHFLHPAPSPLRTEFSAPCCRILFSMVAFIHVRGQVSYPHKTICQVLPLFSLHFLGRWRKVIRYWKQRSPVSLEFSLFWNMNTS